MVNLPGTTDSELDVLANAAVEPNVWNHLPSDQNEDDDEAAKARRQERLRRKQQRGRDFETEEEDPDFEDVLLREPKRNKRKKPAARANDWVEELDGEDEEEDSVDIPARSRKRRRKRDDVWSEDWDE